MAMRLLVVENMDGTPLGLVDERARNRGAAVTHLQAFAGEPVPSSLVGHDGLIILGGAQSALADDRFAHLPQVAQLIRASAAADKPVLGICLGSQLIVRAFGGRNILGRPLEFGYHPVSPTRDAAADPVFCGLKAPTPMFHWHEDTVELPASAVHLATSDQTRVQGFRIGRAVYGFQFHVEATADVVRAWSAEFEAEIAERVGNWQVEAEIARHAAAARQVGAGLIDSWLDQLA